MTHESPQPSFEHPVTPPGKIAGPAIVDFLRNGLSSPSDEFKEDMRKIEEAERGVRTRMTPMPPLNLESATSFGLGDLEPYVLEDGTEARIAPAPTPNR